ncbi:MAG: hypothetical protein ACYDD1_07110 [Caulobacteraceae bacterium]
MSARRLPAAPLGLILVSLGLGGVAACKDPDPVAVVKPVTAPLPAYPAWANGLIGQNAAHVVTGRGACLGVWDAVTAKHVGAHPGDEAGGWGWDVAAKAPLRHILFVNGDNFIVGAGEGGLPRPDVSKAREDVTSPNSGWHGVLGVTTGKILAVGVTSKNASCSVGAFDLSTTADS